MSILIIITLATLINLYYTGCKLFTVKKGFIMKKSGIFFCITASLVALIVLPHCYGKEKKESSSKKTEHKAKKMITLSSGLRYEVLKAAPENAAAAKNGKNVDVHYSGYLNNGSDELGTKFDSSVDRGQPFSFILGAGYVIRGWDEGVATMKVGQKIRLYIPAELGYGKRGAGRLIPPNSDLIFDIELLKA